MAILILFGLPGAGKTFVGNILQNEFGYFFHDADKDLPKEMIQAINAALPITDAMRDTFFSNIVKRIKQLKRKHKKLVIAQTCIKEKYRTVIAKEFPQIQFLLIHTYTSLREERLLKRKDYPLDIQYARKMCQIFEKPMIDYKVITNNRECAEEVKRQLKEILRV